MEDLEDPQVRQNLINSMLSSHESDEIVARLGELRTKQEAMDVYGGVRQSDKLVPARGILQMSLMSLSLCETFLEQQQLDIVKQGLLSFDVLRHMLGEINSFPTEEIRVFYDEVAQVDLKANILKTAVAYEPTVITQAMVLEAAMQMKTVHDAASTLLNTHST